MKDPGNVVYPSWSLLLWNSEKRSTFFDFSMKPNNKIFHEFQEWQYFQLFWYCFLESLITLSFLEWCCWKLRLETIILKLRLWIWLSPGKPWIIHIIYHWWANFPSHEWCHPVEKSFSQFSKIIRVFHYSLVALSTFWIAGKFEWFPNE